MSRYLIYKVIDHIVYFYSKENDVTRLTDNAKEYERIGDAMRDASNLNKLVAEPKEMWKVEDFNQD